VARGKIILALLMLTLFLPVVTAMEAIPGTRIPLVIENYRFRTSTLLFPSDWKPTHIRWLLQDPYGKTVYWVDSPLDSVKTVGSGYDGIYHYTDWEISENSGYIQIPAFATPGEWKLKAQFYDYLFTFKFHKDTETLYTIPVKEGSLFDNLNAPLYFIIPIPLMEDVPVSINLALFSAVFLLLIILIVGILIIREVKR